MKNLMLICLLITNLSFSQTVLLDNQTFTNAAITSNLATELYNSGAITTNPYEGIEITVKYRSQLPAFIDGQPIPFHNIHLVAEKEIAPDVWVVFLSQNSKFVKEENENTYNFQFDPSVINFDEGQPQDLGSGTLSYKIRGRLPAKIRFRIIIIDYKYNQAGAFQSVNINLNYDLYNL